MCSGIILGLAYVFVPVSAAEPNVACGAFCRTRYMLRLGSFCRYRRPGPIRVRRSQDGKRCYSRWRGSMAGTAEPRCHLYMGPSDCPGSQSLAVAPGIFSAIRLSWAIIRV